MGMAALMGSWPQALALLEAGADASEKYRGGASLLMLAAQGRSFEAVDALVLRGADVHAVDKTGRSALGWAAAYSGSSGNAAATRALLAAGADPRRGSESASAVELFAWRWGAADDIAALCAKCDPAPVLAKAKARREQSGADPYPAENMAALAQGGARWFSARQAKELEKGLDFGISKNIASKVRL
jgi:ankyrin repeat protein